MAMLCVLYVVFSGLVLVLNGDHVCDGGDIEDDRECFGRLINVTGKDVDCEGFGSCAESTLINFGNSSDHDVEVDCIGSAIKNK